MQLYNAFVMIIPFFAGYLLDILIGDPLWLPNPTRLISSLIEHLEDVVRGAFPQNPRGEKNAGSILALLVAVISLLTAAVLLAIAWYIKPYLWLALETVLTYQVLSARRISDDSALLCEVLENKDDHGDLSRARLALSRITSEETGGLNRREIIKAGITSVAGGTTSGVVAPMLFLAIGGGSLGVFYKAVDLLRIRLAHDNSEYRHLGIAAEKLAAFCDYVPSRLAAFFMRISARLFRLEYDARLAEPNDIRRANRVMLLSSFLCVVTLGVAKFIVLYFL